MISEMKTDRREFLQISIGALAGALSRRAQAQQQGGMEDGLQLLRKSPPNPAVRSMHILSTSLPPPA